MSEDQHTEVAAQDQQQSPQPRQRLRLRYRKDEVLMYIGHQDLLRLVMKMLRRLQFPFATSGMYSPKPRVTFGPALPLGVMADNELLDIELADGLIWDSAQIEEAYRGFVHVSAPRDFAKQLTELPLDAVMIARLAQGARYSLDAGMPAEELFELLETGDMSFTDIKGRQKNLRSAIARLAIEDGQVIMEGGISGESNLNIIHVARRVEEISAKRTVLMRRLCLLDSSGNVL